MVHSIEALYNEGIQRGILSPLYLLNQINTGQQVHTEIDEGPVDTLFLVFFLLQDEHVVVEELLQLLIGEVNTQLLETVELFGA